MTSVAAHVETAVRHAMSRPLLASGLVALLASIPGLARADGYAWGGTVDGLEVRVTLLGFRDGAGTSGWTEEGARRFARRAASLAAWTGPGASLEETVEDDEGLTLIRDGRRFALGIRDFDGTDAQWEAVLTAVRALGLAPARRARAVRVYTIELAAGASATMEDPPGLMFYERCLPCMGSPAVHVLGEGRRVVGVFDGPVAARRGLRWLQARGVRGRVTPL